MAIDFETDGMRLQLPHEWADVTADLDVPDPPLTLARPDGGVLQFSLARYAGGDEPKATVESLEEMIAEFVVGRHLESTVEELEKAMHPHPTLSEGVAEGALAALGRAIHI